MRMQLLLTFGHFIAFPGAPPQFQLRVLARNQYYVQRWARRADGRRVYYWVFQGRGSTGWHGCWWVLRPRLASDPLVYMVHHRLHSDPWDAEPQIRFYAAVNWLGISLVPTGISQWQVCDMSDADWELCDASDFPDFPICARVTRAILDSIVIFELGEDRASTCGGTSGSDSEGMAVDCEGCDMED